MSRGVNKAIVVGIVGKDPDIRYTGAGKTVCNLTVVTNEQWKDKNTGEKQEKAEWHRIVLFGRVAEIAAQYLKKGSQAYFEGKITTRKWQDQTGADRYSTEIVANEMQMLSSSRGSTDQPANSNTQPGNTVDSAAPKDYPQDQAPGAPADNFKYDDIPF